MAVLPEEIPTGTLKGQFYFVNEDSIDPDTNPELTVVQGFVRCIASVKSLRMASKKAIVIPLRFDAKFDGQGNLVPANGTGVGMEMPAVDSPLFDTTDWYYTAHFELVEVETGFTVNLKPIEFQIFEGQDTDLSDVIPIEKSPGVITTRGIQGEVGPQGIQGGQGPQGIQGIQGVKGDVGPKGVDGSNVIPTAEAVAYEIGTPGTLAHTELTATIGDSIGNSIVATEVLPPEGFTFSTLPLPRVYRLGGGRFVTDLDVQAMRPAPGVTYYVSPSGSDANDGLSPATPLTIPGAQAKADVGTIIYAPGEYFRNTNTTGQSAKSINHIAAGPGVKVTGWNSPSSTVWTLVSGSIYQTSRSATAQIVDVINREAWGDYTVYTKMADLASITGPGQWAIVGSIVYVWPIGNTDLTVVANRFQIRLGLSATYTALNKTAGTSYARGIEFEGQAYGIAVSGGLLLTEDCKFKYSLVDGLPISGGAIISIRGIVSSTATDGFSYSNAVEAIEIDCKTYRNGWLIHGTNNGSTGHGTVRVLRIHGDHDTAGGPVVADVNSSYAWNLGTRFGGSTALAAQNQSYRIDAVGYESNPARAWLDECTTDSSTDAYKVTGPGAIYLHATRYDNVNAIAPASVGTIAYYDA